MSNEELNRAVETIERMQWEMNQLQDEIARLRIRKEEGSGDIAYRLATECVYEATQKAMKKSPKATVLTIHVSRDFYMTIGGTRYSVRVREMDV